MRTDYANRVVPSRKRESALGRSRRLRVAAGVRDLTSVSAGKGRALTTRRPAPKHSRRRRWLRPDGLASSPGTGAVARTAEVRYES